ncbi:hypothetical protein GWK47_035407 [Chionoecetes opilio]|uniref:Uncharacterized protein n=1 Tax=Chionoecetes opilio TaxID=41210 RepID=A0A8J4YU42_CHIOP|nr:hypothetical protein GWK47_035407 [Chionoecetes opilio]
MLGPLAARLAANVPASFRRTYWVGIQLSLKTPSPRAKALFAAQDGVMTSIVLGDRFTVEACKTPSRGRVYYPLLPGGARHVRGVWMATSFPVWRVGAVVRRPPDISVPPVTKAAPVLPLSGSTEPSVSIRGCPAPRPGPCPSARAAAAPGCDMALHAGNSVAVNSAAGDPHGGGA